MLSCFVWSRLWLMVTPLYRGHVLADRAWSLCPIIRFILSIQKQKQQQEHTLESNPCSSTLCSRSCQIFFGDATHAVPWAVPFSTGFLLYSVQAIPSNFLSSMRPFWKSNMLNGKCQGYCTCTYIYIHTCTYIYIYISYLTMFAKFASLFFNLFKSQLPWSPFYDKFHIFGNSRSLLVQFVSSSKSPLSAEPHGETALGLVRLVDS